MRIPVSLCLIAALTACQSSPSQDGFAITGDPQSITVDVGTSATFSVAVRGIPESYQWMRDGADIQGATGPTYTLPEVAINDNAAKFKVKVTGKSSLVSKEATLSVRSAKLAIVAQPVGAVTSVGHDVKFKVNATGHGSLKYQWYRNGVAILGATQSSHTVRAQLADDNARYKVKVTDDSGSLDSNAVPLQVADFDPLTPTIVFQSNPSKAVNVGDKAIFFVSALGGKGNLKYQWIKNGSEIAQATDPVYVTSNIVAEDNNAKYKVRVTDEGGRFILGDETTLAVNIPVTGAPEIDTQPTDAFVLSGEDVTFSAIVSGTGPFLYQWKKDGADIQGANSSVYTFSTQLLSTNAPSYYQVVVSNTSGKRFSREAVLWILNRR